jgi:hypothetical protein
MLYNKFNGREHSSTEFNENLQVETIAKGCEWRGTVLNKNKQTFVPHWRHWFYDDTVK